MVDLTKITLEDGIPVAGDGDVATINALMDDGGLATIGHKADAADTHTDNTQLTAIQIWKQISKTLQAINALLPTALGTGGGLKVDGSGNAVPISASSLPSHPVTNAGTFVVQQAGGHSAEVTFTTGTTGYVQGDAVGVGAGSSTLTFANAARVAQELVIESIQLLINRTALIGSETSYRLYLYNAAPTTINDSAPWDLTSTDQAKFLGFVDIGTVVDLGSTMFVEVNNINKRLRSAGTSLFGILVYTGAVGYTPTAVAHTVRIYTREV